MRKVATIDQYKDIQLNFPVCIVTKDLQYWRYYKDGRFETYAKSEKSTSLTFGKLEPNCLEEEFAWLRVFVHRHKIIPEKEFSDGFNQIITEPYDKFLEGKFEEVVLIKEDYIPIFNNNDEDPF